MRGIALGAASSPASVARIWSRQMTALHKLPTLRPSWRYFVCDISCGPARANHVYCRPAGNRIDAIRISPRPPCRASGEPRGQRQGSIMLYQGLIGAIALAALVIPGGDARAFDDAKYPDWG